MAKHLKRARAALIVIVSICIVVIGLPLVVTAQCSLDRPVLNWEPTSTGSGWDPSRSPPPA